MDISTLNNSTTRTAGIATTMSAGAAMAQVHDFDTELAKVDREQANHDQQVRESAEQFVGMAFYLPLFKQMREDPFKSEMFHGGFGEQAFGGQLDQILADRMAQRDQSGLIEAVMRQFSSQVQSTGKEVNVHA